MINGTKSNYSSYEPKHCSNRPRYSQRESSLREGIVSVPDSAAQGDNASSTGSAYEQGRQCEENKPQRELTRVVRQLLEIGRIIRSTIAVAQMCACWGWKMVCEGFKLTRKDLAWASMRTN